MCIRDRSSSLPSIQFGAADAGGTTGTGGGFGEQDKIKNNKISARYKLFFIISILGVK